MTTRTYYELRNMQVGNFGSAMMLRVAIEQMRERLPDMVPAIVPTALLDVETIHAMGARPLLALRSRFGDVASFPDRLTRRFAAIASRYGLVRQAQLAATLDGSGFAYGSKWGSAPLRRLVPDVRRSVAGGAPFIFLPQAFGPFRSAERKWLSRIPADSRVVWYARDADSHHHLAEGLAKGSQIYRAGDFTDLFVPAPQSRTLPARYALIVPNQRMVDKAPGAGRTYLGCLQEAARALGDQGLTTHVLCHDIPCDSNLCAELAESTGLGLINDANVDDAKSLIAGAAYVVSSRFHACISALSSGVPCVGTSWSHKYERLFEQYGYGSFVIEPTAAAMRDAMSRLPAAPRPAMVDADDGALNSGQLWDAVAAKIEQSTSRHTR